jgi:hypothetical protein
MCVVETRNTNTLECTLDAGGNTRKIIRLTLLNLKPQFLGMGPIGGLGDNGLN